MALVLDGTNGVSLVQDGVVTAADLASGAITASALPAGSVLQVVSAVNNNYQEVSSTTYTDTATTASITPSSTSSKILVIVHGTLTSIRASESIWANLRIYRNSTSNLIYVADYFNNISAGTDAIGENKYANSFSINHLDSPSSTSATSYTLQIATGTTSNSGRVRLNNSTGGQNTNLSNITLMEIAG